jgi:tetratricopeptide (TPR) repeat protein
VKLDPSFALANRRLAQVITEQGSGWQGAKYAVRAGALNRGLSPRDSLLVLGDSMFLWLARGGFSPVGSLASSVLAERLLPILREAVWRYPEDEEAWYALGLARFNLGVWLVRTGGWRDALEDFKGAVDSDSLFAPAYSHLVDLYYARGDTANARRYAVTAIRLNPQNLAFRGFQALHRLLALSDTVAQARVLDSLPDDVLGAAVGTIALWLDPTELTVRIARHRLRAASDSQAMLGARAFLVHVLAFRGHLREALAIRETVPGAFVPAVFADAAQLGYVPEDQARTTFGEWLQLGDAPTPALALPWWGARRDTLALQRFQLRVDSVARFGTEPNNPTLPRSNAIRLSQMASAARAHLTLARGDTATALRRFDSLSAAATPCVWWCQGDRLLFARLLVARGRLEKAARLLNEPPMLEGNVLDASPAPLPSDILWYLERGRVAERLGDSPRAREAYRYVATAWLRPDPELEPYAAQARAGLARLTAKSRQ